MKRSTPLRTSARRPYAARRGSVLIAVVVALIILQLVVVGVVTMGSRDQQSTNLRLQAAQAQYSADAGAAMALREIFLNTDEDGDGAIGTVSNDSNNATDPSVGGGQVCVVPVAVGSGRKFSVLSRAGSAIRAYELWVQGSGASIEGFEPYAVGVALNNVGGWAPWDGAAAAVAYASNTVARTGAMSCDVRQPSDSVHLYTPTSGQWIYTVWQYIPSSATGADTYIILMNTYVSGGSKSWSTQVRFNLSSNTLNDNLTGGVTGNTLTIVRNQWVPFVVTMDLTAGTQTVTYNNQTLFTGSWNRLGGVRAFAAVDLYGSAASHVYYDDIQLAQSGATSSTLVQWSELKPTP